MPEETQSTDQQIPPKETPTKTSHKINWLHILIGVVIGVVLLGVGFGVYFLTQSKEESTTPAKVSTPSAKQATPSATATPSSEKDETADWKTYKDSFYNISYGYPEDWEQKTKKEGVQACRPSIGPKGANNSGLSVCEFGQTSVEELANLPDKANVSMKKTLAVSGKTTIRQVVTENNKGTVYAYIGNVDFNGQKGTFTIIGWPQDSGLTIEGFVETFDQILLTFKFLPSQ